MNQLVFPEKSLLRLCIDPALVVELSSHPLGEGQKITSANGEILLDVFLVLSPELLRWIQCLGPKVEVLHPPGLRELIRQDLSDTLHKYRLA